MVELSNVQKNIVANYLGAAWGVLANLVFVPVYLRFLGIEAYGLIGFFASLQAVLGLLDLGIGQTLSREVASLSASPENAKAIRNTVRTFTMVYWGIAILVGLLFALGAPVYARFWLHAESLSESAIVTSTVLMACGIAIRWPGALYVGTLTGLQRQVATNIVQCFAVALRGIGAVLILWLVSSTITAFFAWQIVASLITTVAYAFVCNRVLPQTGVPSHFDLGIIKSLWRFAAGMTVVSFLSLILTQTDKFVLSKLLTLEEFGYYALAATVSSCLSTALGPITSAIYPRLSQLQAERDMEGLQRLYHSAAQLVSFFLIPTALTLSFFSFEVLFLWTQNCEVADKAGTLLSVMALGTMLNGLMHMPYQIQLAFRWTRLINTVNAAAVLVLVPMLFVGVLNWGAIGGPLVWVMLNLMYLIVVPFVMHRRILISEKVRWYIDDLAKPLVICAIGTGLVKILPIGTRYPSVCFLRLLLGATIALGSAWFALPSTRKIVLDWIRRTKLGVT